MPCKSCVWFRKEDDAVWLTACDCCCCICCCPIATLLPTTTTPTNSMIQNAIAENVQTNALLVFLLYIFSSLILQYLRFDSFLVKSFVGNDAIKHTAFVTLS